MLNLEVVQMQWVVIGITGGFAVMVMMILAYLSIWRPREPEPGEPEKSLTAWYFGFMPWLLTFTFVSVCIFGIIYAVYRIYVPPNF